jgi:hypothetical protein
MSTALGMFPFTIGSQQVHRPRIRSYEPLSGEYLKACAPPNARGWEEFDHRHRSVGVTGQREALVRSIRSGSNPADYASARSQSRTLG